MLVVPPFLPVDPTDGVKFTGFSKWSKSRMGRAMFVLVRVEFDRLQAEKGEVKTLDLGDARAGTSGVFVLV